MVLTAGQLHAIQKGEPVPVMVGKTECVLVRKDRFQHVQRSEYDDSDWSDEEMTRLAEQMFDSLDQAEKIP
jgi:hypothetical protein